MPSITRNPSVRECLGAGPSGVHMSPCTSAALEVFFQPTLYNVSEGTMAIITLVTSTPNYTFPFNVSLVYSDMAATSSEDYSPLPDSVAFGAGQQRLSFPVEVLDDQVLECLEHFSVLAAATDKPGTVAIGAANVATVAILDGTG